jgi:hypothetical protein
VGVMFSLFGDGPGSNGPGSCEEVCDICSEIPTAVAQRADKAQHGP